MINSSIFDGNNMGVTWLFSIGIGAVRDITEISFESKKNIERDNPCVFEGDSFCLNSFSVIIGKNKGWITRVISIEGGGTCINTDVNKARRCWCNC